MNDDSFTCHYYGTTFPIMHGTMTKTDKLDFNLHAFHKIDAEVQPETVEVYFYKCPKCDEVSIRILGVGSYFKNKIFNIRPNSEAKQFPSYVPLKIRQDYEEACAIVDLSPKSSATLSRRCLQAMISDFWDIKENRLLSSINALKGKVPATQWEVIDAIRLIGNIGAHPELDINTIIEIEPGDAKKLIRVIEFLIKQWYVERYEQEKLFSDVLQIKESKKKQRKFNK